MAYDYIAKTYGRRFKPGQSVLFTEYDNKPGTVRRVRGNPHYVSIKFDDGTVGRCHPDSLLAAPKGGAK